MFIRLPSSIAKSIVFDTNLLSKGCWTDEEKKLIEKWIKEDGFEEKRAVASKVISHMIKMLLGKDCSRDGSIRSKRLGEMLQHFEDLLATTKGGIAKKFYRDHLNHLLRVMLLANAIGKHVKSFSLSENEIRVVTLTGLIHDVAYPLSESYQILNETTKAITKCYESLSFPQFLVSCDMEKVTRLIQTLNLKKTPISFFGPFLNNFNHGLMGAIEFLDYINPRKQGKYTQLLRAMVFHDPALPVPQFMRNNPLLLVLVLGDEMQDWGRPAGLEREPAISEIDDFQIGSSAIHGIFQWKDSVDVSPLRQISAKVTNFRRLVWPTSLKICMIFKLLEYNLFDSRLYEEAVVDVVKYCMEERPDAIESFNASWKKNKELFRSFYGNTLPEEDNLTRYLLQKRPGNQRQKSIYFSNERKEILQIDRVLGKLDNIRLEIDSGDITQVLHGKVETCTGSLYCQSEGEARQLVEDFTARLIVFHGLSSRVASEGSEGLTKHYPYPSQKLVEKAMQTMGLNKEVSEITATLRGLRRCLAEEGFFSFISG